MVSRVEWDRTAGYEQAAQYCVSKSRPSARVAWTPLSER